MKLTEYERKKLKLAAGLLEMASDRYANFGCNDFDVEQWFSPEELTQLTAEYAEHNRDPSEMGVDWLLMRYMAHFLDKVAGGR